MTMLKGQGFVAIWNGITPGHEQDFKDWHLKEHMPERLAIPGFLAGTRWCAEGSKAQYFTLYELQTPEIARSEAYRQRLDAPTPWTRRVMTQFIDNSRCVGEIASSRGEANALHMAVIGLPMMDARIQAMAGPIMALPGVQGWLLGRSDVAASSFASAERKGRLVREPQGFIMIGLSDPPDAALSGALQDVLGDLRAPPITFYQRELRLP